MRLSQCIYERSDTKKKGNEPWWGQCSVGSGVSGLNRRRARSNEWHGPLDFTETFPAQENETALDSSRQLESPKVDEDMSTGIVNLPHG